MPAWAAVRLRRHKRRPRGITAAHAVKAYLNKTLNLFLSAMQALFSAASCDPAAPVGMQRNALGR